MSDAKSFEKKRLHDVHHDDDGRHFRSGETPLHLVDVGGSLNPCTHHLAFATCLLFVSFQGRRSLEELTRGCLWRVVLAPSGSVMVTALNAATKFC